MISETELRFQAERMGIGSLYDRGADLRENFRFLHESIEKLPEHLIERGRDLIYPQLHNAVLEGDCELVQALLDIGVGPDAYTYLNNDEDDTPLESLAEHGEIAFETRTKMAELLIVKGAYVDDAVVRADDNDDEEFMEFLQSKLT